uniref:INO80 complex subunit E N-terminal domain-containing protein n=1 Tax=Varanus komodoensis TaxID=61221 RepID=A0A8D2JA29_VARKO
LKQLSSASATSAPIFAMKKTPRKHQGERYRLKFRRLCRAAKVLVYENAALCDEIARLEAKYLRVREERRFLLARLLQAQALTKYMVQSAVEVKTTVPPSSVHWVHVSL